MLLFDDSVEEFPACANFHYHVEVVGAVEHLLRGGSKEKGGNEAREMKRGVGLVSEGAS